MAELLELDFELVWELAKLYCVFQVTQGYWFLLHLVKMEQFLGTFLEETSLVVLHRVFERQLLLCQLKLVKLFAEAHVGADPAFSKS